jgi:hypothetical protein
MRAQVVRGVGQSAAAPMPIRVEAIQPCVGPDYPARFRVTAQGFGRPGVAAARIEFASFETTTTEIRSELNGTPVYLPVVVPAVRERVNVWIEPVRGAWLTGRGEPRYEHNIVATHATVYPAVEGGVRSAARTNTVVWTPARAGDYLNDRFDFVEGGPNGGYTWLISDIHQMEMKVIDFAAPRAPFVEIQPLQATIPRGSRSSHGVANLFCSGNSLLPDGRVLAAGGHSGVLRHTAQSVHTFNPARPLGNRVTLQSGEMAHPRWYPTQTMLPNGMVLINSGSKTPLAFINPPNRGGIFSGAPIGGELAYEAALEHDIYSPAMNGLLSRDGEAPLVNDRDFARYPGAFVLPSSTMPANPAQRDVMPFAGSVFMTDRREGYLFTVRSDDAGRPVFFPHNLRPERPSGDTAPVGAWPVYAMQHRGARAFPTWGSPVLLPLHTSQATRARVIFAGGQGMRSGYTIGGGGGSVAWEEPLFWDRGDPTTNTVEIFDYDANVAIDRQSGWRSAASMQFPRVLHDATLLADGNVLVTGGASTGWSNDPGPPVLEAELFDSAEETWTTMEPSPTDRRYHSVAFLLEDGTVVKSGSHGGLEYRSPVANIVPQFHSDVFYPPYLYRAPQPVFTSFASSQTFTYGATVSFAVANDEATEFRVAFLRMGGVTHGLHMDQRFVWMENVTHATLAPLSYWPNGTHHRLSLTIPSDRALVPPGWYMIFVLNSRGVPTRARMVSLR